MEKAKTHVEQEQVTRAMKFDVFLPKEQTDTYKKVINNIKLFRALARKMYSTGAMAEITGATITESGQDLKVIPVNDAGKQILAQAFNMHNYKRDFYEMRQYILDQAGGTWIAAVWDDLRSSTYSRWVAKDAERNATRKYLTINGVRDMAKFNNIGIGLLKKLYTIDNHHFIAKWDKGIGTVEFVLKKLDDGRYYTWKNLVNKTEGWGLGTAYLKETDGVLSVQLTYKRPVVKRVADPKRKLVVSLNEASQEYFFTMHAPNGKLFDSDKISVQEAVAWVKELRSIAVKYEERKAAVGNPWKRWGSRKAWVAMRERIHRLAERRKNGQTHRNHLWTRRVIECAARCNCGSVVLDNVPTTSTLFGEPWSWYQFTSFLKYKTEELGISLHVTKTEKKKVKKTTKKRIEKETTASA